MSISIVPYFLYAIHFYSLAAYSVPKKVGIIEISIMLPFTPLLARIASL
nr:MAG TPA: hypothetical protein [Bacteriophage sp.]